MILIYRAGELQATTALEIWSVTLSG